MTLCSLGFCCKWQLVSVTQPHRVFGEKCYSAAQRETIKWCVINILPKSQVIYFLFPFFNERLPSCYIAVDSFTFWDCWETESIRATLISYHGWNLCRILQCSLLHLRQKFERNIDNTWGDRDRKCQCLLHKSLFIRCHLGLTMTKW